MSWVWVSPQKGLPKLTLSPQNRGMKSQPVNYLCFVLIFFCLVGPGLEANANRSSHHSLKQSPNKNDHPDVLESSPQTLPVGSGLRLPDSGSQARKLIASVYLSETFINEQIKKHLTGSELVKRLQVHMDTVQSKLNVNGLFQVPFDDYESLGIDPSMAQFQFQLTVKPQINNEGYLVLEFPLRETFFSQASSRSKEDRVVIPTQLVSLGIAATRSYLSALSGDFSGFEKKKAKLRALLAVTNKALKEEKNEDAKKILQNKKRSLELEIEAVSLQRVQFESSHESLSNMMGLIGESEFDLNNKVKANENTIFLKLKLDSFLPYLKDINLGGIRIQHKDYDDLSEDYFALDVHTTVQTYQTAIKKDLPTPRRKLEIPASMIIRLNQELFLSESLISTKKDKMGESIKDFKMTFMDDGLHVTGRYKKWLFSVPFDTLVDFVSVEPDVFEVRLRKLTAWGLNLKFLTRFALRAVRQRLDNLLQGICKYEYLGRKDDDSQVLRVTVEPAQLIPAFPNLHLMDIDVLDKSFLLRIGRKQGEEP
jgi:hypothetical protein